MARKTSFTFAEMDDVVSQLDRGAEARGYAGLGALFSDAADLITYLRERMPVPANPEPLDPPPVIPPPEEVAG